MVRTNVVLVSVLFCMLGVCAAPAMAGPKIQPGVRNPGMTDALPFEDLDKNHDGKLMRSEIPRNVEALKQLRAHFNEADLDGNGSLSKYEYQRYVSNIVSSGV